MSRAVLLVLMLVAAVCAKQFAVTGSSIEALKGSLSSVRPPVRTPPGPEMYIDDSSCLGVHGPLGAYGPLGMLGPVGNDTWNPSTFISGFDWSWFAANITGYGGPLSNAGPLGPSGPISPDAYNVYLPSINDFCSELRAGGVWAALGPLGPLGCLGPLGPLGPIGAHGYKTDNNGQYIDSQGYVVRSVSVPYASTYRQYPLVEMYTESFAHSFLHDTSFGVYGVIDSDGTKAETDAYTLLNNASQFVIIVVVPEQSLTTFYVKLMDGNGTHLIAQSVSNCYEDMFLLPHGFINHVHFTASPGKYQILVTAEPDGILVLSYRLYVVGSTAQFVDTPLSGKHQVPLK